jgi:predicted ATPase
VVEYQFGGHAFLVERRDSAGDEELSGYGFFSTLKNAVHPSNRWPAMPLAAPGKAFYFPHNLKLKYPNAGVVDYFEMLLEDELEKICYLGPLREPPSRDYRYQNTVPSDVGIRGEKTIEALIASEVNPDLRRTLSIERKQTFEQLLAKKLFNLRLLHSFELKEIASSSGLYQVRVRRAADSPAVLLTDVGFGISQLLPVLVLCYYAPPRSILIIEQPELHLHPSVQSELADILIDVAQHRNLQIIVESHSEHLLKRLQRRIAEEILDPDDVSLYFCEQVEGESRLQPLELDAYGNIKNWPADFFGDEFAEMAAMTQAVMERKAGKPK